ncbi:CotH kinase family protein [Patescibacteria group bacterium]|nr:CotH kinase family protein [Patescibacteria group bacterium]MBU1922566.1 CotH kinase family protein [Patescibacteria group bacterium]
MSIAFRRHFWLVIVFALVIGACLLIGSTRVISYNFGEGKDVDIKGRNYDNEIYLFDDSVAHKIEIGLNQEDYDEMVRTYQETGEKEYFLADVTIDGVTVPDAGVRLKGNLTLRQTLGGSGNGQDMPGRDDMPQGIFQGDGENQAEGMRNMANLPMPAGMDLPDNWQEMSDQERRAFMEENGLFGNGMGRAPMGGMGGQGNGGNPPFLIKIDQFVAGQTYQNFAEIAVRLGSDESLLGEPVAFYIHETLGQIVPKTAYAIVRTAENEPSLYVICEHIDEKYVEKYFPDSDGILYKAGNFVGFEYKGDDPTLYAEMFEQKTNVNDDDLAPLIRFMKFVSESGDEEFENELPNWLDMDSFIRMMALDNLLSNNDSFVGMGSNFYLYYDKNTEKFTMLSWDMNLAMGGMGGMMRGGDQQAQQGEAAPADADNGDNAVPDQAQEKRQEIFEQWLEEGGFDAEDQRNMADFPGGGPGGRGGENTLKERFFANEKFSQMYDAEYERLEQMIFNQVWVLGKIKQLAQVFTDYNAEHNITEQSKYDAGVERMQTYIEEKQGE